MISAIDTNVLLDILIEDVSHVDDSRRALAEAYERGSLVISEMVYAELAARFETRADLDAFVGRTRIRVDRMAADALHQAGQAWSRYLRNRPTWLQCAQCGERQAVDCRKCGTRITRRQQILADFIIGAHALAQTDQLLTRDRGFYSTYFPELSVKGAPSV